MNQVERYVGESEEEFPLGAYATLMLAFVAGFGTMLVRAQRQKRLPRRLVARDILLLGVATHKITQLVTRDRVLAAVRFPFTRYQRSAGAGEIVEQPRGHGWQRAIGTLLTCQFCAGPWTAAAFTAALIYRPRETRAVAGVFAVVTLSDFMHQLWARARHAS
jgi:hypothetical protein